MTNEERNEIVDAVFELLGMGDVDNVLDIIHPKNLKNYFRTLATNSKIRKMLSDEFLSLLEAARKTQLALDTPQQKEVPDGTETSDRNSI